MTSLTQCRLQGSGDGFIERKVEVESASAVQLEDDMTLSMKQQAIACKEIRKLVKCFNQELWPKDRLKQYQQSLKKTEDSDKDIEDVNKKIDESLQTIAGLEEQLESSSRQQLRKTAELKSELQFLNNVMHHIKEKMNVEETRDFERLKILASLGNEAKKKINIKLAKCKAIEVAGNICAKYEKLSDKIESSDDDPTEVVEMFFKKVGKVEADCVMLRNYKTEMMKQNEKMKASIKGASHQCAVQMNLKMLRLDPTPSVGQIVQVSHQLTQIKAPIDLRKRFTLCKDCQRIVKDM